MQDSIIVYRNPLEKMFWESFDPTYGIYIAGAGVGMLFVLGVVEKTKLAFRFPILNKLWYLFMILGGIIGVYVTRFLISF
jgi:hypothetical protein